MSRSSHKGSKRYKTSPPQAAVVECGILVAEDPLHNRVIPLGVKNEIGDIIKQLKVLHRFDARYIFNGVSITVGHICAKRVFADPPPTYSPHHSPDVVALVDWAG